jgi:hypothetical protein
LPEKKKNVETMKLQAIGRLKDLEKDAERQFV